MLLPSYNGIKKFRRQTWLLCGQAMVPSIIPKPQQIAALPPRQGQ
jgi:hypothetical protein